MICGIDEVNFSPSLAGDCVVCAFARTGKLIEGVADSKTLSQKRRLELFAELQGESLYYVVPATPNAISRVNIYLARNIAAITAIEGLNMLLISAGYPVPEKYLLDGYWSKLWLRTFSARAHTLVEGIVGGDAVIYEISAASIVAKCYVDALFAGWERLYPLWGLGRDHGSLSDKHLAEIRAKGPSPLHRVGRYAPNWWKKIREGGLKWDGEHGDIS